MSATEAQSRRPATPGARPADAPDCPDLADLLADLDAGPPSASRPDRRAAARANRRWRRNRTRPATAAALARSARLAERVADRHALPAPAARRALDREAAEHPGTALTAAEVDAAAADTFPAGPTGAVWEAIGTQQARRVFTEHRHHAAEHHAERAEATEPDHRPAEALSARAALAAHHAERAAAERSGAAPPGATDARTRLRDALLTRATLTAAPPLRSPAGPPSAAVTY